MRRVCRIHPETGPTHDGKGQSIGDFYVDRSRKEALVAELQKTLEETTLLVVTHQNGLTVREVTELRRNMRAEGTSFHVTKNRLAKIALKGTDTAHAAVLRTRLVSVLPDTSCTKRVNPTGNEAMSTMIP